MSEKQPQVEADQIAEERLSEESVREVAPGAEFVDYSKKGRSERQSDTMAGAAGLQVGTILNCQGDELFVRPQPSGVWTAITNRISHTVKDLIDDISTEGLASLVLLNEIGDVDTQTAKELRANAVGTAVKEAIPKLISKIADKAPDVLADVVSMILEPNPMVIKENRDRKYSVDYIKWNIPVGEQIHAVALYIDSMNLEELSGKVAALLPAASLSGAADGTRS